MVDSFDNASHWYGSANFTTMSAPECRACAVGTTCSEEGITVLTLPLDKGYWRQLGSANVYGCPDRSKNTTGCVGGSGDPCKLGLNASTPYCRSCAIKEGHFYSSSNSECVSCGSREWTR